MNKDPRTRTRYLQLSYLQLPQVGWVGVTAQVRWNTLGKMVGFPGSYLCATRPTQVEFDAGLPPWLFSNY